MQSFQIITPVSVLAPYIWHYWILQDDAADTVSERTLPIGLHPTCVSQRQTALLQNESRLQPQSFVCGQSVGFSDVVSTGRIEMITVVFQPYAAKVLLHIPVNLFHGQNVSMDEVGDTGLSDLSKQVADTPDNTACIRLIEQFFLRRLYSFSEYNLKRMSAVFQRNQ